MHNNKINRTNYKIPQNKNSCGYNEISTKILKIRCPFINSPINYTCNKMLFWGVFHDRLKYTIIKLIHKNYNRCEVSDYRPLSLLTSFSKIFETVMQRRILKHLTKYNVLSTEQYGFRVRFRADTATHKLTTEILNAMNNKRIVVINGGVNDVNSMRYQTISAVGNMACFVQKLTS